MLKEYLSQVDQEYLLVQADLSQAELRIGCSLAFEENMINIYKNDGDVHATTGLNIAVGDKRTEYENEPDETRKKKLFKEIRQQGKPANFGLIYGGSHIVLMQIAKISYGVELTEEEAFSMRKKYFELYPNFLPWHESYRDFVARYGYIVSPYGRIRHLPEVFLHSPGTYEHGHVMNQAINAPVQSACADFLAEIWTDVASKTRRLKLDTKVVLTVHDSLVWSTHRNDIEELIELHTQCTRKLTDRHRETWLQCPMTMDFEVGVTWGDLVEMEL